MPTKYNIQIYRRIYGEYTLLVSIVSIGIPVAISVYITSVFFFYSIINIVRIVYKIFSNRKPEIYNSVDCEERARSNGRMIFVWYILKSIAKNEMLVHVYGCY